MKKTPGVCGSAFSSSFSELGYMGHLHSWSRLFYVIGCELWSLRSQTTASLICKPQGTQMMCRDKPALQNIVHCFPGLIYFFTPAFKTSWKRLPTISSSAGYLTKSLPCQTQGWPTQCSKCQFTVFNSELINSFNSLGINCMGERWQNTTTWTNFLFKWGKMPSTSCIREKGWRSKSSYSFMHTAGSGNWLCSLLKWLC